MKKNYQSSLLICVFILFVSTKQYAQCPSPAAVPYYQGFEGINTTNQLPNTCWSASNLGVTCLTYTTGATYSGSKLAAFYLSPTGANYFYTEGITLVAGVIYSTSIWYKTDNTGGLNWTDLSLLVGTSQTSTGLIPIVSTNGPASSSLYLKLSGTFSVSVSGTYYIAIRGTSTLGLSEYLYLDEFRIGTPCGPGANSLPTVSIVTSAGSNSNTANTLCNGYLLSSYTLTASGANSYTWYTMGGIPVGTGSAIVCNPFFAIGNSFSCYVNGTSTLTGCASTFTSNFTVLASPSMSILTSQLGASCPGQTVTLSASGATTYSWSTGATTPSVIVTPSVTNISSITVAPIISTTYVLIGSLSNGCSHSLNIWVPVYLPTLSLTCTPSIICSGSAAILTGAGATNLQWAGIPLISSGNTATVSPTVATIYSLTGKSLYGCIDTLSNTMLVQPTPTVSVVSTSSNICAGETVTLTASGAVTYQWIGISLTASGNIASAIPNASTTYTVKGTGTNGCSNAMNIYLQVDKCTGLEELNKNLNTCKIYPNPGSGLYLIESGNSEIKNIVITDLSGKIIFSETSVNEKIFIDLSNFSNGMYNLKISSGFATNHVKIIKE